MTTRSALFVDLDNVYYLGPRCHRLSGTSRITDTGAGADVVAAIREVAAAG